MTAKRNTSVSLSGVVLFVLFAWMTTPAVYAQSWSTVDGGGTYGVSSATSTNSNFPSVAVFNGAMYAIWQEQTGTEYEVHVKKYDGSSWATAGNSAGSSLLYSSSFLHMYPKLVCYNNALYAAWSGFDAGIYVVHVIKYDGSSWTYTQDYTVGEGRSNINNGITANAMKIDLCVFNNELYATWVEQDHLGAGIYEVRVSKFNGALWTSVDGNGNYGINYNTAYGASYPTLCVLYNALYAAWTESNISATQVRVRRYDGGSTWTFVDGNGADGLNYSTGTPPYDVPFSLSSFGGYMYVFWTENNRVRVKRYDGSNWTTDIDGGTGWNHNSAVGGYYPACYSYDKLYVIWEQNPVPRQVRVVSFNGSTKTFIDGDAAGIGINNSIVNRGHFPKLTVYAGDLFALWSEELSSTSGSANQIRAKKYPLPPLVESVGVPSHGTYVTGQSLSFTAAFSKNVTVSGGIPYIPITFNNGGTVNANYIAGSGTSALEFRYTLVAGNSDYDGITVGSSIVLPPGCTLRDANPLDATLTLNSVGSTTAVLVSEIAPTTQTSAVTLHSNAAGTTLTVNWINGNGANRAVFMKQTAGTINNPNDGAAYTASADWTSKGSQLGSSGYYCIYNGTGTSVSVTGTSPNTDYVAQAFEYNGSGSGSVFNVSTATENPSNATSLPVELSSFTSSTVNHSATLAWTTATEVNNYGFEVERRTVGSDRLSMIGWKKVGFVEGSGTVNSPREYSFTDEKPASGTYAYRLKQIDNGGAFTYSGEVTATIEVPRVFALEQNFPNPFNPSTTIAFTLAEDSHVLLRVFDCMGREMATLVNQNMKAGELHSVVFDASRISSGMYFYRLDAGKNSSARKFILLR